MPEWLVQNYEVVLQLLGLLYVLCIAFYAFAAVVVKLTPSDKDNILLEKVHSFGLKIMSLTARLGIDIRGPSKK